MKALLLFNQDKAEARECVGMNNLLQFIQEAEYQTNSPGLAKTTNSKLKKNLNVWVFGSNVEVLSSEME